MARSLWKGKSFISEFISPTYGILLQSQLKVRKLDISSAIGLGVDDLKVNRRNHQLLTSQSILQYVSFLLYNGYDYFGKIPILELMQTLPIINLATAVLTREINVIHKTKTSKAARKVKAKQKKSTLMQKTKQVKVLRVTLARKYKK